jgi:hypothetical protein
MHCIDHNCCIYVTAPYYKVQKCISLNKTILIDISLELVLKIIFIYKINQIDFAAIHAAISKC